MRLLIIDDETIIRRGLVELPWHTIGIREVLEADSADVALRILQSYQIQILLCDIQMPGMDGLQFAELAKQRYPQIAIILLSGFGVFSYAQRAIKCGVFEYLLKPSSPEEIMSSVRRAMEDQKENLGQSDSLVVALPPFLNKMLYSETTRAVLDYLEQHYMEDASLSALAAQMNYSAQYLSRLVKKETQHNFVTLLSMIRMAKAAGALVRTEDKVYQICDAVGIPDQRYFSQLFKNTFGETPLQFRRTHQDQAINQLQELISDCVKRMDDKE